MNNTSPAKSHLNIVSVVVSLVAMFAGHYAGRGGMGPPGITEFLLFAAIRIGGLALAVGLALTAMIRGEEPFPITITAALLPPLIGAAWILHR